MNRIERIILVCSLAILAVLLIANNAKADVITNIDIPFSGPVFNPCNGETVTVSGVDHFLMSTTVDAKGGFHGDFHDNIHATGAGDLGNSYEVNLEDHDTLNGRVGTVQTMPFTTSAISKGSAPNFEVHALFHITVLANGTVTAFVSTFTSSCRG